MAPPDHSRDRLHALCQQSMQPDALYTLLTEDSAYANFTTAFYNNDPKALAYFFEAVLQKASGGPMTKKALYDGFLIYITQNDHIAGHNGRYDIGRPDLKLVKDIFHIYPAKGCINNFNAADAVLSYFMENQTSDDMALMGEEFTHALLCDNIQLHFNRIKQERLYIPSSPAESIGEAIRLLCLRGYSIDIQLDDDVLEIGDFRNVMLAERSKPPEERGELVITVCADADTRGQEQDETSRYGNGG